MACFLAIDQGSHASRAILFDEYGSKITDVSQAVPIKRLDANRVEQNAEQILVSIQNVIRQLLSVVKPRYRKEISACGIAIQRSTVVAWNRNGDPLGPALSWQDTRATDYLKTLKSHEKEIQQITGLPLSAHYGASKLHWLLSESSIIRQCSPEQLHVSPLISYVLYHLLDDKPYLVDHSNAQRTQLMALDTLDWSSYLINLFNVPENYLPVCMPICQDYGTMSLVNAPISAVCGDQNAAMFGAGILDEDTAFVNIGSGAFIIRHQDKLVPSVKQLSGIACSDSRSVSYIREATINGAGSALDWIEKKWNVQNMYDHLQNWVTNIIDPPVFINTIGGLGSPWWRGDIDPVFIGDGSMTEAARVVAIVESIVFMIQANLELIMAENPVRTLRVSGGLSKLDGLCQKLSDLSGFPVERTHDTEATARGVAWLAAGRPDNWKKQENFDCFTPKTRTGLMDRYHIFVNELNRLLEIS